MVCKRCNSTMDRTRRAESALSIQEWWGCPRCGTTHYQSEPVNPLLRNWLAGLVHGAGIRLRRRA